MQSAPFVDPVNHILKHLSHLQVRHKRASAHALAFAARVSKASSRYRDDPYDFEEGEKFPSLGVQGFAASSCASFPGAKDSPIIFWL